KTIRMIAYRYAARARLVQQVERTVFEDTVVGRRVVISSYGGRLRLRESKRGPKTQKGRRRYTGADCLAQTIGTRPGCGRGERRQSVMVKNPPGSPPPAVPRQVTGAAWARGRRWHQRAGGAPGGGEWTTGWAPQRWKRPFDFPILSRLISINRRA